VLATELVDLHLTPSEINTLAISQTARPDSVRTRRGRGRRPTTLTACWTVWTSGHISRGTRPGDRRAVLIELTSSGHDTATTIRQAITTWNTARSTACQPTRSPACALPCKPDRGVLMIQRPPSTAGFEALTRISAQDVGAILPV